MYERERAENNNVLLDSVWYSCISRGKAGNPPKSGQQGPESGSHDRGSSVCIFVGHVDRLALGPGVRGSIRYLESGSGSHPMGKKKF